MNHFKEIWPITNRHTTELSTTYLGFTKVLLSVLSELNISGRGQACINKTKSKKRTSSGLL